MLTEPSEGPGLGSYGLGLTQARDRPFRALRPRPAGPASPQDERAQPSGAMALAVRSGVSRLGDRAR